MLKAKRGIYLFLHINILVYTIKEVNIAWLTRFWFLDPSQANLLEYSTTLWSLNQTTFSNLSLEILYVLIPEWDIICKLGQNSAKFSKY